MFQFVKKIANGVTEKTQCSRFFPCTPYDRGNCVASGYRQARQILEKAYLGFHHQEDSNLHTPFAGDNTQTRLASSYMNHSLYMPQGSNCLG